MTKKELGRRIYEASYLTGEFVLRSGETSDHYFDKYQFEGTPLLLDEISIHMLQLFPFRFHLLGGLEMGGIPLSTALSLKTGLSMVCIRRKAKEYGTRNIFEGPSVDNKIIVAVEDVVTTGGAIIKAAEAAREFGADINHALCVIDREEGAEDNLAKHGIELRPLFRMSDLKK
ncbi:MAG: orotate phosphoribosyltransferase [Candidatus Kapaibacterium sp.]